MSASRLHSIGLVYEVATCFVMALATFWQFYLDNRTLPNLTWVPAVVILFPLILPGPPRRMLAAAILAGAMPLLALLLLEVTGNVDANPGYYVDLVVGSAFAVVFAYMGARVVYRLGREGDHRGRGMDRRPGSRAVVRAPSGSGLNWISRDSLTQKAGLTCSLRRHSSSAPTARL